MYDVIHAKPEFFLRLLRFHKQTLSVTNSSFKANQIRVWMSPNDEPYLGEELSDAAEPQELDGQSQLV